MKSMIVMAAVALFGFNSFGHDEIPGQVAISKATELGVHRIERLVTLKKIDETFQTALVAMKAERTTENGAVFKVSGIQAPGADGTASVVTLWMDGVGKTLSFTVTPGAAPANPVQWPAKDAVSLVEEGLHFVLEGWAQHPEVKAFYTGLQSITLAAVQDAQGQMLAEYKVTSDDDTKTLTIQLKPDGTFVSYDIK
jgi:hypothetical protein